MNKASSLGFVSNAILYWNTIKINDIVEQLRQQGEDIDDETFVTLFGLGSTKPRAGKEMEAIRRDARRALEAPAAKDDSLDWANEFAEEAPAAEAAAEEAPAAEA